MSSFLSGAIMMASAACGLFFLKSWYTTSDRLFLYFSLAFWALSVERWVLIIVNPEHEMQFYIYTIRMVAFLLIAAAIVEKNRRGGA